MNKQVALIGVYPPPVGGISIHIERLSDYLDEQGITYTLYDNTSGEKNKQVQYTGAIERWSLKYFFTAKESVIHCHFLRWQVRFFLSLLKLRGKRIIFTIHSYRPEESVGWLKKVLIGITGRLGDVFICVNEQIEHDLQAVGIPSHKIRHIPAFIAPKESDMPGLPIEVEQFIADAQPLLVANGAIGTRYKGEDLYGVDLCVELVHRLLPDYPKLKLVFCVTHITQEEYFDQLKQRISEYEIGEHIHFVQGIAFYPLVQRADLMLRPTSSDGDALSIRESIYFGTAVLASDCAKRPDGVVSFKNRDIEDLVLTAREMLLNKQPITQFRQHYAEPVLQAYELQK